MTIYHRARRAKKKQLNKKKVITCLLLGIILCSFIYLLVSNKIWAIKEEPSDVATSEEKVTEEVKEEPVEEKKDEISDVEIPATMGKYEVLGQLVIEKIGVTKNILNISEDASLKLSVAKLYGPDVNASGNFCISGHNWNNILKRLDEMNVGEQFYLITRETKERIDYEIYDKYSCEPTDLSCLNQNQDGKKEVTLITCNPGGLTRLICKAREI